jgi:hypothetical protein
MPPWGSMPCFPDLSKCLNATMGGGFVMVTLDGQDGMGMHSGFNRDKAYDDGKKNIKKS